MNSIFEILFYIFISLFLLCSIALPILAFVNHKKKLNIKNIKKFVILLPIFLILFLLSYGLWMKNCPHDYILIDEVVSTCDKKGEATYECSDCGHIKSETLPLSDNHNYEEIERVDAQINISGYIKEKCTICSIENVIGLDAIKLTLTDKLMALGYAESEAIQMKEIFNKVGITEVGSIHPVENEGIENLHTYSFNLSSLQINFTVYKSELAAIEVSGIPSYQTVEYINMFGNVKTKEEIVYTTETLFNRFNDAEFKPVNESYQGKLDITHRSIIPVNPNGSEIK